MSRRRIQYARPEPLHDVGHDELRDAVEYLGGALVEDYNPSLPSEVTLQWSPRTAQKMRPQQARTVYSGWRAIPLAVVDQIIDAYHDARREHGKRLAAAGRACRSCKARGVLVEATHELMGVLCVCQRCHDENTDFLADIEEVIPRALPYGKHICKRCGDRLYHGPNVAAQIQAVGRFALLCPRCWRSRQATSYVTGEVDVW